MRGLEIKGTGEKRNQWELILFFFFSLGRTRYIGKFTVYKTYMVKI